MSAAIEPMAGRHIEAVMAIDGVSHSRQWSAAAWRKELAGADRNHLVVVDDRTVVAHAGTLQLLDELHVTNVATHPEHRGRGHATRLLVDLLRAGAAAGATAATLEVRAADRATHRVYARLGFAPAGIRPGYYSAPTDDALIMWLDDLRSPASQARINEVAAAAATGPPASDGPTSDERESSV
ncbi:MAG: ribosomal protein S18-alanine N-acetyltransferase [Actinomycetota bacterium]